MERVFYTKRRKIFDLPEPTSDELANPALLQPIHAEFFSSSSRIYKGNISVRYISRQQGSYRYESISYESLAISSQKCAETIREHCAPQSVIGLCIPSSIPAIIAFLGILQADCVVAPIDTTLPAIRKTEICRLADIEYIFFAEESKRSEPERPWFASSPFTPMQIRANGEVSFLKTSSASSRYTQLDSGRQDIAYLMFTSGTTGSPKLVWVPHKCAQANIVALKELFLGVGSGDKIMQVAPLSFDPSVVDIFLALSSGATLTIMEHSLKLDPALVGEILLQEKPRLLQCTPSFLRRLDLSVVQHFLSLECLRYVALGGEAFPTIDEIQRWLSKCPSSTELKFFNLYGITEVSIWASAEELPAKLLMQAPMGTSISLGEPLLGTELLLVDPVAKRPLLLLNELAPPQFDQDPDFACSCVDSPQRHDQLAFIELADLFVGGPERRCRIGTDEKSPKRWRRTGDQVRFVDGRLYFVGRSDGVVKRLGKRFHPEEVSALLRRCPLISNAYCWGERSVGLNAIVVPVRPDSPEDQIRTWAVSNVPDYMRPDFYFISDQIPTSMNGKPDISRLNLCPAQAPEVSLTSFVEGILLRFLGDKHMLPAEGGYLVAFGATSLDVVHLSRDFAIRFCHGSDRAATDAQNILLHSPTSDIFNKLDSIVANQNKAPTPAAENLPIQTANFVGEPEFITYRRNQIRNLKPPLRRNHRTKLPIVPGRLVQEWRTFLGKCIDSSPVIISTSSGNSYCLITSHSGVVACIDVATGDAVWKSVIDDRFEASCELGPDNSTVWIGGYSGTLYGIDLFDGTVRLSQKLAQSEIKSAAVLDEDSKLLWISCHDGHLFCVNVSQFTFSKALSMEWKLQTGAPVYASPVVHHEMRMVYVAGENGVVYGINSAYPFGVIWMHKVTAPVFATPLLADGVLIVPCADGNVYCIDVAGKKRWQTKLPAPSFSAPTRCYDLKGSILFQIGCHDGVLYTLNGATGNIEASCHVGGQLSSAPCALDIAGGPNEKTASICTSSSGTIAIVVGGELIQARTELPGPVFSSPVLCAGNRILFGCRDDHLYCFSCD